ncbi:MAG: hypothetical protein HOA58_07895 [Rhodospirillaceae bacterium]|jgi:hypothetical protein|nr:hypothetical protein [Rhodospirillaceae bacterium]MBT6829426.1 hypothetical protein [Rhodospirillaceae bacterium]MBT7291714.1 hypothetical protein [Rhodospirillaceae bacterium]
MDHRNFHKTNRPFDKLRKKRTGSSFDAVDFHGRNIDLPAIAGVVESARRSYRKAGETNEDKIEEAAERVDATARADAANEFYGGPKFNAERFAKAHNIDMNLRFDAQYERPDQIVANPPRTVTPPKPESKPSFQEVMYPKANMPARPRPAAKPPKPAKAKPGSTASFQEVMYPKANMPAAPRPVAAPGGQAAKAAVNASTNAAPALSGASGDDGPRNAAGTGTQLTATAFSGKRSKGNNIPALGEEAKAAFQREFNAARKAAEARGERFDAVEFYKIHGEPMVERAEAARKTKVAEEERRRKERVAAEENDIGHDTSTKNDNKTQNSDGDDTGFFEELGDGFMTGVHNNFRETNANLLIRNSRIMRIYKEINDGKPLDQVRAENDDLVWDSLLQPYLDHPKRRQDIYAEMRETTLRQISRIAQLSKRISYIPNRPNSAIQEIAEEIYPGLKKGALTGIGSIYGAAIASYNSGYGEGIVKYLEEADADLSDENSIYDTVNDPEKAGEIVRKAKKDGVKAVWLDALTSVFTSGGKSRVQKRDGD